MRRLFFSIAIAALASITLVSCGEEKDQAPQGEELFKTRSVTASSSSMEAYKELMGDMYEDETSLDSEETEEELIEE